MKFFNFSVHKTLFKVETLQYIIAIMQSHRWIASVDLKDAFVHIKVEASHHRFLRFHWPSKSYQFRALPLGLSSAPWVFTKTLAPLIA